MSPILPLAAGLALGLVATVAAQSPPDAPTRALADERAVIATADALDHAVDLGDWAGATALFAPAVRVDLTAFGAPAVTETAGRDLDRDPLWRIDGFSFRPLHVRGNAAVFAHIPG